MFRQLSHNSLFYGFQVRYAQLQKVQEKLAHDMEMCISRRDGIVELAQAREKRSTKRALYTRQQFLKKLDDLQKKITQTNNVSHPIFVVWLVQQACPFRHNMQ